MLAMVGPKHLPKGAMDSTPTTLSVSALHCTYFLLTRLLFIFVCFIVMVGWCLVGASKKVPRPWQTLTLLLPSEDLTMCIFLLSSSKHSLHFIYFQFPFYHCFFRSPIQNFSTNMCCHCFCLIFYLGTSNSDKLPSFQN